MIAVVNCLHCNELSNVDRQRKCDHCGRSLTSSIRAAIRDDLRQFTAEIRKYKQFAAGARKQLAALKGKR
jgi:hypothetical protein